MRRLANTALALLAPIALGGCMSVTGSGRDMLPTETSLAYFPKRTQTQVLLQQLPAPQRQVAVAVYGFSDQTGQFKPTEAGQTLSRAVTQGASSMLVKALQDAGSRQWFTIVERERLDNLLKERQIISEMRKRYLALMQKTLENRFSQTKSSHRGSAVGTLGGAGPGCAVRVRGDVLRGAGWRGAS